MQSAPEMSNEEMATAFEQIIVDLRSLTEEAARRLTKDKTANQQVQRAYRAGSHMLATLENIKRPDGSI